MKTIAMAMINDDDNDYGVKMVEQDAEHVDPN